METQDGLDVDGMLLIVGEFGLFQWLLDAIFSIIIFPSTYATLIMYFAALKPDWKCVNNSTVCLFNVTLTAENTDRCHIPRNEWEYAQPTTYSIVSTFDLICDKEWLIYMTTSSFFIGSCIGCIVWGWVSDKYGRKTVLFPCMTLALTCGLLNAFMPNIVSFIVCRVFVGFFFEGNTSFVMINEFVGSKHRPLAGMILFLFFALALCTQALHGYLIRAWKVLFIVCTAPYFFVILFYKFVPESVRWLHLNGSSKEAMEVLRRIGEWNNKPLPNNVVLSKVTAVCKPRPIDLFGNVNIAVKSTILAYANFVFGMIYYGISLSASDLGGSIYRNYVLLSIVEFPACLLAIYSCQKFGRKKSVMYPLIIGAVCLLVISGLLRKDNNTIARVLLGAVAKLFVTLSFDALLTWSVEIYPTTLRAEGVGFINVVSRIGAAGAPWVSQALVVVHGSLLFIVMGALAFICSGLCIILPETKDLPTLETLTQNETKRNNDEETPLYPKHN